MSSFQVIPLTSQIDPERLTGLMSEDIGEVGSFRKHVVADHKPGYPCRLTLADAEPGESLVLLHYWHHDVESPYRSSGPIYVRKNAQEVVLPMNTLPSFLHNRLVSVRAYDQDGMMLDASVVAGQHLREHIDKWVSTKARYAHVHNAATGCFLLAIAFGSE